MKKLLLPAMMAAVFLAGCSKNDDDTSSADFATTKDAVITDFVGKVAMPSYTDLKTKAATLKAANTALVASGTEANLTAARNAWKDMRSTWEKCEGFLFGPVDQDEYDPETDTWPVNHTDLDLLLASAQPLSTEANIEALTSRSLKGYHPIEYILWGQTGTKAATAITAREKEYLTGLSLHLSGQANLLYNSWIAAGGNYSATFLTAGKGSTIYAKKYDAFKALVDGMVGICDEVGTGKMVEPFDAYQSNGAQLVESPFSGNSVTDFKNNIIGAYNVYLGKSTDDGAGIQDLVKIRNNALNVELEAKFNTAINSFNNITVPYEQAITTQRTQCKATMDAITDLSTTLDTKLGAFILQNITD